MGTRSLTIVYDENNTELMNLYYQWDGYPTGHGATLYNFIKDAKLVNGFTSDDEKCSNVFNGMGEFAVRLITYLKNWESKHKRERHKTSHPDSGEHCLGSFHLEGPYSGDPRGYGAEYVYTIRPVWEKSDCPFNTKGAVVAKCLAVYTNKEYDLTLELVTKGEPEDD